MDDPLWVPISSYRRPLANKAFLSVNVIDRASLARTFLATNDIFLHIQLSRFPCCVLHIGTFDICHICHETSTFVMKLTNTNTKIRKIRVSWVGHSSGPFLRTHSTGPFLVEGWGMGVEGPPRRVGYSSPRADTFPIKVDKWPRRRNISFHCKHTRPQRGAHCPAAGKEHPGRYLQIYLQVYPNQQLVPVASGLRNLTNILYMYCA